MQRRDSGEQEWGLVDAAMEATDIWKMRDTLKRLQAKIADYVIGSRI